MHPPPFPQHVKSRFDLWPALWPTDLTSDHLLIKDYLPTKFEASGAKRSWVISCTRCWRLTWSMTLGLLTWISIGIIYALRTLYLPTKFEVSEAKCPWVISCTRYGWSTRPLTLTFDLLTWIFIEIIYLSWTIYLQSLKLAGQSIIELSVAQGIGD